MHRWAALLLAATAVAAGAPPMLEGVRVRPAAPSPSDSQVFPEEQPNNETTAGSIGNENTTHASTEASESISLQPLVTSTLPPTSLQSKTVVPEDSSAKTIEQSDEIVSPQPISFQESFDNTTSHSYSTDQIKIAKSSQTDSANQSTEAAKTNLKFHDKDGFADSTQLNLSDTSKYSISSKSNFSEVMEKPTLLPLPEQNAPNITNNKREPARGSSGKLKFSIFKKRSKSSKLSHKRHTHKKKRKNIVKKSRDSSIDTHSCHAKKDPSQIGSSQPPRYSEDDTDGLKPNVREYVTPTVSKYTEILKSTNYHAPQNETVI